MKLDVMKLFATDNRTVELDYDEEVKVERADIKEAMGPAHVHLTVLGTDNGVIIKGTARQKLLVFCYRCLAPFEYDLLADIYEDISFSEGGDEEEGILSDDKKYIDLDEVLNAALYLSLPMRFECSENCVGLGITGEEHSDESDCHDVDPRLAVLKKYFEKD
ncbi:YceD family protein [Caldanaerobius polysaccharolyticus]|uniref:YceD family protein n=1 Tax=Caldanaerobius polysaccharolyticus TaxID=44256 RepID=UPI00068EF304|nr:DUF177 domain-containing protein [Caldanaerobius polysaccharolyticus]